MNWSEKCYEIIGKTYEKTYELYLKGDVNKFAIHWRKVGREKRKKPYRESIYTAMSVVLPFDLECLRKTQTSCASVPGDRNPSLNDDELRLETKEWLENRYNIDNYEENKSRGCCVCLFGMEFYEKKRQEFMKEDLAAKLRKLEEEKDWWSQYYWDLSYLLSDSVEYDDEEKTRMMIRHWNEIAYPNVQEELRRGSGDDIKIMTAAMRAIFRAAECWMQAREKNDPALVFEAQEAIFEYFWHDMHSKIEYHVDCDPIWLVAIELEFGLKRNPNFDMNRYLSYFKPGTCTNYRVLKYITDNKITIPPVDESTLIPYEEYEKIVAKYG